MAIVAILITSFLEQQKLLLNWRDKFIVKLKVYLSFFINRNFNSAHEIRYVYLFACLPVVAVLFLIKLILHKHFLLYFIFKLLVFFLTVEILTWKEEAKIPTATDYAFINTFANRFFAALFWFLVLPAGIGSISYLIILMLSNELKNKGLDLVVYNVVVDKMLFYANFIPYFLMYIFIAIAGNFEDATHFIVEQRKNFSKSSYFLEQSLREIILIAIGKDKFQVASTSQIDSLEVGNINSERYNPQVVTYITAILYRTGLFFIGFIFIITLANMLR
jgi:hypothetical protein